VGSYRNINRLHASATVSDSIGSVSYLPSGRNRNRKRNRNGDHHHRNRNINETLTVSAGARVEWKKRRSSESRVAARVEY
jgi:hypothetical protein